jgi:hypothetical protein
MPADLVDLFLWALRIFIWTVLTVTAVAILGFSLWFYRLWKEDGKKRQAGKKER